MFKQAKLVAFLATSHPTEAKAFYQSRLGLQLVEESDFALVFLAGGTTLRIQKVGAVQSLPYTAMGWEVKDIAATLQLLASHGVTPQRFDGLTQNEQGVWQAPDGAQVAWFRDPDVNLISITQPKPGAA